MTPSISKRTYRAMYRLLNRVSPVPFDCGKLCGSICCTIENHIILLQQNGDVQQVEDTEDEALGIYLFPGEDRIFSKQEDWLSWDVDPAEWYDFPDSWSGNVYFLRCLKAPHCHRDMRPLQCRFYPAAPHIKKDGSLVLIFSTEETPYTCPLIGEAAALDRRFLKATHTVCKRLAEDPLIFDLFMQDSEYRREDPDFDEEAAVLYPLP